MARQYLLLVTEFLKNYVIFVKMRSLSFELVPISGKKGRDMVTPMRILKMRISEI